MCSIAATTARNVLRTRIRRRWIRSFSDSAEEQRCERAASCLDPVARRALRGVYATLSVLSDNEQAVFALRHIDGMALREVASACQVSVATIKRWLDRAERRFHANARRHPELTQWLESSAR